MVLYSVLNLFSLNASRAAVTSLFIVIKSMITFSMVLGEVMEQIPYKATSKHMKDRKVIGSSQ